LANYADANADSWTQEVLKSNMLTVVYFWHETCPWCIRLNPIFNDITEIYRGRIKFVKLNVLATKENGELASSNGVMGTPTLMFFCQGRSLGQTVSFMSKEDLEKVLDGMLGRYERCLSQSTDLKNYVV
jgi:thioredoxin-like negative regulator of GroEL